MATNSPIKYTSRTFTTIMDDINSDVELRPKPNWWKRLWAGIGDVLSMWVNVAANLAFLRTAFTRQAVADHLSLIDYQIGPHSTASGRQTFDVKRDAVFPMAFAISDLIASTAGSGAISSKRFESRTGFTFNLTEEVFTADASSNELTIANTYIKGEIVRVRTDGALPAPLTSDTDYYVIEVSSTKIKLALSRNDAYNGIAIDITSAGSGNHTIKKFSFTVAVYQQKTLSAPAVVGAGDGITPWLTYNLPDKFVLQDTLSVVIGTDTWTKVDTLVESMPSDKHFLFIPLSDNDSQIRFGDDVYGKIPQPFDIEVLYATGGGANSNVPQIGIVNQYAASNPNISGTNNPDEMTGGSNEQSLADAKILGPMLLKSQNRFITTPDGVALSENYPGVALAKVNRNAFGVLSAQVLIVPDGGGTPSPTLLSGLQSYLIDRTVLESIDVRVQSADYNVINPSMTVKVSESYLYADVSPFIELALILLFTETSKQIKSIYDTDGIVATVSFINNTFTKSFTEQDYSQINALIVNMPINDFAKTFQRSDIEGFIDVFVNGVDYVTYTGTVPIVNTANQITQIGTITLSEVV